MPPLSVENTENDDVEPEWLKVSMDDEGILYTSTQVDAYLHQNMQLKDVCFYDFVRCFKKVRKTHYKEQGYYKCFTFTSSYHECESHILIQIIDPSQTPPDKEIIPRVIGTSIPHKDSDETYYYLFMLAHFAPYSATCPLPCSLSSLQSFFNSYLFTDQACSIMKNWEAIHECEDECEAGCLQKRETISCKNHAFAKSISKTEDLPDDFWENLDAYDIDSLLALSESQDSLQIQHAL